MGEIVRISDIRPDTAIMIPTSEGSIAMSVDDVLQWVAPPGTPKGEALKFLMTCKEAQVNPFLKEAHLVDYGGKYETVIDKSGWLKRANGHPKYDGFEAGLILRPVDITTKPPTPLGPPEYHEGAYQPEGYQLLGGWAKVYRKDRSRPTYECVSLGEYRNPKAPNWINRPCMMIRKVALVQALREAGFLVSGGYDRDEMPDMDVEAFEARVVPEPGLRTPEVAEAIDVEYEHVPAHQLRHELALELEAAIAAAGMNDWQRDRMLAKRGVTSIVELNERDALEILSKLHQTIDQQRAGEIMLPDPQPAAVDVESYTAPAVVRS